MKGTVYAQRSIGGIADLVEIGNFTTLAGAIRLARKELRRINDTYEMDVCEESINRRDHRIVYYRPFLGWSTVTVYAVQTDSVVPTRIDPRVWR